jgi:hypothetical protein
MVTPTPRPRPDATVFEIAFVPAQSDQLASHILAWITASWEPGGLDHQPSRKQDFAIL